MSLEIKEYRYKPPDTPVTPLLPLVLMGLLLWFIIINSILGLCYNWNHPELTEIQVLQNAQEWAIPWRFWR